MTSRLLMKRHQKKYNVPVIGHFGDKSVRFKTILEAEKIIGINYNLIFEACIGKIYRAGNVYWEFEKETIILNTRHITCAQRRRSGSWSINRGTEQHHSRGLTA